MHYQVDHLGDGTRTNIYSGYMQTPGKGEHDDDDDDRFNNNLADRKAVRVVLKILDQSHKDVALVSRRRFHLAPRTTTARPVPTDPLILS